MIVVIKKLISGIRKFCVFLFWPRKSDKNRYHTIEALEPSVIFEAKDGKYGEDGSETLEEYILRQRSGTDNAQVPSRSSAPESCLGDLKSQISYLIGMERQSGSMDAISPLYVSRMLNVPLEDVEKCMKEMEL